MVCSNLPEAFMLNNFQNAEVSDTTGDAIIYLAHHPKLITYHNKPRLLNAKFIPYLITLM